MRIDGRRYSKKFLATVRGIQKNFGTYVVGCFLAGQRIPAGDAICLLGLRSK